MSTPDATITYFNGYGFEEGYFAGFPQPFPTTHTPFMAIVNLATGELKYTDNYDTSDWYNDALILSLAQQIDEDY